MRMLRGRFHTRLLFHHDVQGWVRSIRKQSPLGGMEGLDQALAGERLLVEDVEGPGIEREPAGVGQP